jgi:hypothetical protein
MKSFTKDMVLSLFLCIVFALITTPAESRESVSMKKVAIIGFVNIEQSKDVQYIEASITDAIRKSLESSYAFKNFPEAKIKEISETNYFLHEDFHFQSIALNLGLLAKQDLVVTGSYRVVKKKKTMMLYTDVLIIDIGRKKVRSRLTMEDPADDRIGKAIDAIAARINNELADILPDREEWQRKHKSDKVEEETGAGIITEDRKSSIINRYPILRLGYIPWTFTGIMERYDTKVNACMDLFLFRHRYSESTGLDFLIRVKFINESISNTERIQKIGTIGSNFGARIITGTYFAGIQWQPYGILAYQFIPFVREDETNSQAIGGKAYNHIVHGFMIGTGVEFGLLSYFGLFIEMNYGYAPFKSKITGKDYNSDGLNIIVGVTFRVGDLM